MIQVTSLATKKGNRVRFSKLGQQIPVQLSKIKPRIF